MPNVRCDSIQYREGAEPPVARFRYVLDDSAGASDYPSQFEQLWPLAAAGPYVVQNDDRIVVLATRPPAGTACCSTASPRCPRSI